MKADEVITGRLEHPDSGGSGIPNSDPVFFNDFVPVFGVKTTRVNDSTGGITEGSEDLIRNTGDPAWVGGAPINIFRFQIKDIFGS